ncbi:hypothetical protein FV242_20150 [Methylobacterium sp. WL64]|uniref:hypothetical protein n=1 Tax=Methylobacterium sp. WL64 TaxID=2603894 RepID=UPI0011C7C990|nr:hypothetical protein [Methylobacterium sp. WL64]TXN00984.1 hypothetical protein FV242_20150 [Methylobacterium sp. WL64]
MINDDLHPPHAGLNADPILYGVAAGLAALFPPVLLHGRDSADLTAPSDGDEDRETRDTE